MAAVQVLGEAFLHQQRQRVHPAPHVGDPASQPDPHA